MASPAPSFAERPPESGNAPVAAKGALEWLKPFFQHVAPAPAYVAAPDTDELTSEERATVSIFDRNTPSVVNIANLANVSRGYVSPPLILIQADCASTGCQASRHEQSKPVDTCMMPSVRTAV